MTHQHDWQVAYETMPDIVGTPDTDAHKRSMASLLKWYDGNFRTIRAALQAAAGAQGDELDISETAQLSTWMFKHGYATGHGDTMQDLLRELTWQVEERIRAATNPQQAEVSVEELARAIKESPGEQAEHGLAATLLEDFKIVRRG